jgi:hypothetical protein
MSDKSDALLWAADHLQQWCAHFTTREQRRIGDWLESQVRTEAVRVRDNLPDTPDGTREAFARLCKEES